ncbi:oligoribonuclease [Mariprofundus micogutta]|uniref:Oligoribonuclease n=1 Tax=Mariprofundus micogutta TaxID=1921010 RepID=A0A1L8CRG4_9PROT|nr:oligoribonuclease [Mariprofundus micogutta]GAV21419.1 oligoribonuclease [Mariprofundus micogutta]
MNNLNSNLVWMDLEMTGLDPDIESIIEIATIVTDGKLNILAEGPSLVIHQPDEILDRMDDWNTKHHAQSGLTAKVRASKISMAEAEEQTMKFIKQYVAEGESPLCGNSIHQDRRFLVRYMPTLEAYVHYRNIDVSTIKELGRRWYPTKKAPIKRAQHLAMSDVRESIKELAFYRKHLFR